MNNPSTVWYEVMAACSRHDLKSAFGILFGSLLIVAQARGDMGPSFGQPKFVINLTFLNGIPDGDIRAVLLAPESGYAKGSWAPEDTQDEHFMIGLSARLAEEPSGSHWSCCSRPEFVSNNYSRPVPQGKYPRRIRLALCVRTRDQFFLTDEADTSRRINNFTAVFSDDGTGTLTRTEVSPLREYYVLEIFLALAATLAIELAVVLVWIRMTTRRASARRVLMVAIAGNLITVPAVWVASLVSKVYFDNFTAFVVYASAEVAAILVEAALYVWLAKFTGRSGYMLSFTANCLSFLCGCCLVSLY